MEDATTLTLEDGLQAEQTSSEDEDVLTQEGRGLKDLWKGDEGKESWDEHEDEATAAVDDEDEDEDTDRPHRRTIVLILAVVVVALVLVRTRMK